MARTKLISNKKRKNHLYYILQYFMEADEVWLATAFLKTSGLTLLLPAIMKHVEANKPITIIVGLNFGLTQPQALTTLFELFSEKVNANLFLDKAAHGSGVFHPKLFMFKSVDRGTIISGSANITNGGLTTNQEVSLVSETKITSSIWKETVNYFDNITSLKNANLVNLMLIKRYAEFHKDQFDARKNQKVAPDKSDSEYSFNYKKLKKRLKKYQTTQSKADFKQREKDYKEAKKLLNEIARSEKLTQIRFEEIIDLLVGKKGTPIGLWKSGSLLRLRHEVKKCKNEFIALVQFIKEHQKSSSRKVFEKGKQLVGNISGAGINYVTEIMLTYQPKRFANLNSNPIKVLKEEAGVYYKAHRNSFNGYDYQEYCLLMQEIAQRLKLKNLLAVDSFFNEIYWKIK